MSDSSQQTRSHPVTERYVTSDAPLLEILRTTAAPDSAAAKACLAIEESLEGKRLARDAIRLAQAVPIEGANPELLILMLASWADLSCRIGRPSEAEMLIHRSKALVSDTTHAEITARTMHVESLLADTTGSKEKCERILREILDTLPDFSPRRKFYVWDLALLQALQGRGAEADDELKKIIWQCNRNFGLPRVHLIQFVSAVETGQLAEARGRLAQVESATVPARDAARVPVRGYQALLDLMQGDRSAPSSTQTPHAFVAVTQALLHGDTESALKLARIEADRMGTLFGSGFAAFDLVRAELAAGNGVAAARLVRMRRSRGNQHYLDDFFLSRVEWHAGNRRTAARHFSDALASMERYKARARLDFELTLACETGHTDIVELTRLSQDVGTSDQKRKKTRRFKVKPAAGGEQPPPTVILGRSDAMTGVRRTIKRFADLNAPILITGETGVGKELVARSLHQTSRQREAPFTPVNCGSIAETLLESELFGHEKGAFTGAERAAEGLFAATADGTIFLDEIGDISPRLQGALLRVLETGEIRSVGSARTRKIKCRVVAATNVDLEDLAGRGTFRQDLLFRLRRLDIHIPPLRDRRDDILLLVRHFLDTGRPIGVHADLSAELRDMIRSYDWPGNVRELRNVIERMRLLHSDKLAYGVDDLDLKFRTATRSPAQAPELTPAEPRGPAPHAPSASPLAPPPPTPAAAPVTDVGSFLRQGRSPMRRRTRLRELFTEHRRLTRSEIIQILQVSPNTATKDLKILIEEGYIVRVAPSASSRSYYFEIVDAPREGNAPAPLSARGSLLQNP